jgi:hypothetical protein
MEFFFVLLSALPVAAFVFVVFALWRILMSMGAIEAELAAIRAELARQSQRDSVS